MFNPIRIISWNALQRQKDAYDEHVCVCAIECSLKKKNLTQDNKHVSTVAARYTNELIQCHFLAFQCWTQAKLYLSIYTFASLQVKLLQTLGLQEVRKWINNTNEFTFNFVHTMKCTYLLHNDFEDSPIFYYSCCSFRQKTGIRNYISVFGITNIKV